MQYAAATKSHGGIIFLDPHGHIGIAHNTPRIAWA